MPTENRSSNTDMVSVPFEREERYIVIKVSDLVSVPVAVGEPFAEQLTAIQRRLPKRECLVIESDWPEYAPTWAAIERRVTGAPAPQPHPEPIAWMVGTAIWWTKEEAERDAAATGLPTVGLGPMSGIAPAEQHQGEPVVLPARREWNGLGNAADNLKAAGWNACLMAVEKLGPLYTHADPAEALNDLEDAKEACAEIERTGMPGEVIREMNDEIVDLRDALEDLLKGSGSSPGAAKKYAKARAALARKA